MMLAQRILDTLRANGPIAAGEFPKWFGDIERMDLDAAVGWLLKKNSISFSFNKYEAVEPKLKWHTPFISQAGSEPVSQLGCNRDTPPSAAEEVAASLNSTQQHWCEGHQTHHPVTSFQRSNFTNKPLRNCKAWNGAKHSKAYRERHPVAGTVAPPDTSAPLPPGSTEPPATSSAGSPCTGLTQTAEALSPVGAGVTFRGTVVYEAPELPDIAAWNTSPEASAVSPRTSLDTQPPAAADGAAGQTDEFLKRVAAKLTQLAEARDGITCEMDDLIQLEVLYREMMGIAI